MAHRGASHSLGTAVRFLTSAAQITLRGSPSGNLASSPSASGRPTSAATRPKRRSASAWPKFRIASPASDDFDRLFAFPGWNKLSKRS